MLKTQIVTGIYDPVSLHKESEPKKPIRDMIMMSLREQCYQRRLSSMVVSAMVMPIHSVLTQTYLRI